VERQEARALADYRADAALGDRLAPPRDDLDEVAVLDPRLLGVVEVYLEDRLRRPADERRRLSGAGPGVP